MTKTGGGIARAAAGGRRATLRWLLLVSLLGIAAAGCVYAAYAWLKEQKTAYGYGDERDVAEFAPGFAAALFSRTVACPFGWDGDPDSSFSVLEYFSRIDYLWVRHGAPHALCDVDREKHWAHIEKFAGERDWPEAQWLLALKYAYGDYYDYISGGVGALGRPSELGLPVETRKHEPQHPEYFTKLDPEAAAEDQRLYLRGFRIFRAKGGGEFPFGNARELDAGKARTLLIKAAEGGWLPAMRQLSHAYYTGVFGYTALYGKGNFPIDLQKSTEWLKKAVAAIDARWEAGNGCVEKFYLAHRYYHGIGADKNPAEARRLFGDAAATVRRAEEFYFANDAQRRAYYEQNDLQRPGFVPAICLRSLMELAWMNAKGEGGKADPALAQEIAENSLRHMEEIEELHMKLLGEDWNAPIYGEKAARYIKTQAQAIARHIAAAPDNGFLSEN